MNPLEFGWHCLEPRDDVIYLSYQLASVRSPSLTPPQSPMPQFARSRFDHVGLVTDDAKPDESWVEATRVWVTSPRAHPYNVEWLRFEPDTPVTGPLRTSPTSPTASTMSARDRGTQGARRAVRPTGRGDDFLTVAFARSTAR